MGEIENFPWLKSVFQAFSRTFPAEYSNESLKLLHMNLNKELQQAMRNKDQKCLQKLFSCLRHLYSHFCWKVNWQKDTSCMKLCCVKILSNLIQIGIILNKVNSTFSSVNIVLAALKIFPGTFEMLCDAFLLLSKLKKYYYEDFGLILKQFLFTTKFDVKEPSSYFKTMLLLRRLKFLTKDKFEKSKVISLAEKIEVPPNCITWLVENEIENASTLCNKSIIKQFFNKKLPPTFFGQLRQVLQNPLYFDTFIPVDPRADITKSLVLDASDIFKIDLERDECLIENSPNANETVNFKKEEINSLNKKVLIENELLLNKSISEKPFPFHNKRAESISCSFVLNNSKTSSINDFNRKNTETEIYMVNKKSEIIQTSTIYVEKSITGEFLKPGNKINESVVLKPHLTVAEDHTYEDCNEMGKSAIYLCDSKDGKNEIISTSNNEIFDESFNSQTNLFARSNELASEIPLSTSAKMTINETDTSKASLFKTDSEINHIDCESSHLQINVGLSNEVVNNEPNGTLENKESDIRTSNEKNSTSFYEVAQKTCDSLKEKDVVNILKEKSSNLGSETHVLLKQESDIYIINSFSDKCHENGSTLALNTEINDHKTIGSFVDSFQESSSLEDQKSTFEPVNNVSETDTSLSIKVTEDKSNKKFKMDTSSITYVQSSPDFVRSVNTEKVSNVSAGNSIHIDTFDENKLTTNSEHEKLNDSHSPSIFNIVTKTNSSESCLEATTNSEDHTVTQPKNTEPVSMSFHIDTFGKNKINLKPEHEKFNDCHSYSITDIVTKTNLSKNCLEATTTNECQTVTQPKNTESVSMSFHIDTFGKNKINLNSKDEKLNDSHSSFNSDIVTEDNSSERCLEAITSSVCQTLTEPKNSESMATVVGPVQETLDSYVGNILYKLVDKVANRIDNTKNNSFETLKEKILREDITPLKYPFKTNSNVGISSSLQNSFSLEKVAHYLSFSDVFLDSKKEKGGGKTISSFDKGDGKLNGYRDLLIDNISESPSNYDCEDNDTNECSESDSDCETDSEQSVLSELKQDITSDKTNKELVCVETFCDSLAESPLTTKAGVYEQTFDSEEAKIFIDSQPKLVIKLGRKCNIEKDFHCQGSFKTESCVEVLHNIIKSKEPVKESEGSTKCNSPEELFCQLNANLDVIPNEMTDSKKNVSNFEVQETCSPLFQTNEAPSSESYTKDLTLSTNNISEHINVVESPIQPSPPFESTSMETEKFKPHMNLRNRAKNQNLTNKKISKKRSSSKVLENSDFNQNLSVDLSRLTLGTPPKKKLCKTSLQDSKEEKCFLLSSKQNTNVRNEESKYVKSYNLRSSRSLIKPSILKILK